MDTLASQEGIFIHTGISLIQQQRPLADDIFYVYTPYKKTYMMTTLDPPWIHLILQGANPPLGASNGAIF